MTSDGNESESKSSSSSADSPSDTDTQQSSTGTQPQNDVYSDSNRIGVHEGWPVHIGVSQEPAEAEMPQAYGVNLFIPNEDGDNIDIARIDTAHAGCHMDRFYLPEGHPERTEDYSIQYSDPDEAYLHFVRDEEWRYYVKRYRENHRLPAETRVYG